MGARGRGFKSHQPPSDGPNRLRVQDAPAGAACSSHAVPRLMCVDERWVGHTHDRVMRVQLPLRPRFSMEQPAHG